MSVSHTFREMSKMWLLTVLVLAASGCATVKDSFSNRIVCTIAQDKSFVASMWGLFGFVTPVDSKDGKIVCPAVAAAKGEVK